MPNLITPNSLIDKIQNDKKSIKKQIQDCKSDIQKLKGFRRGLKATLNILDSYETNLIILADNERGVTVETSF